MLIRGVNKRGQITIFIIVALVLVAGIGVYLFVTKGGTSTNIPSEFQPVENYYLSCISELGSEGIGFLESTGGFIELPEFVRGSPMAPLSSQLNFFGNNLPYWFYSSDGKIVSQAPTKNSMEEQLGRFIEERLDRCDFADYSSQGYEIDRSNPSADVSINDREVVVNLRENTVYTYQSLTSNVNSHNVKINSDLGKMYSKAIEIFNNELQEMFLENYTLDVLRLYTPVDGVEISCAPKVWRTSEIFDDMSKALEANVPQIRLMDLNYNPTDKNSKYFTRDIASDGLNVYFRYSPDWFTSMEIQPSDGGLLTAQPVGNQEGLGVLGFCYVPYHFVYSVDYPVMVQILSGTNSGAEVFQYPMQVMIRGNRPRQAVDAVYEGLENTVCKYPIKSIEVSTYDSETLSPVEAQIEFKCLSEGCNLGETKIDSNGGASATLRAPQCVNGFLTAHAEGYENEAYQISTNSENSASILLDRLYEFNVDAKFADGNSIPSDARTFIYFIPEDSEKSIKTVVWPEQKSVKLSEGNYNITASIFENSSLNLPSTTQRKCFQVPRPGFAGVFGLTKEECYNVLIPGQKVDYALAGGGSSSYYMTQSQLRAAQRIEISIPKIAAPRNIESLQNAYNIVDSKKLVVSLI